MPQRLPWRRLVASARPMCSFDKVLNQRVDWVAWATVQIYGARDAIDDACTTSSGPDVTLLDSNTFRARNLSSPIRLQHCPSLIKLRVLPFATSPVGGASGHEIGLT